MTPTARVRVVVVNFNGGDLTLRCVDALLDTDWPRELLEVVVVDNASNDDVVDRLRRERPEVRVIALPRNRGFGAGCNAGLQDLGSCDHVALVNPDTVVGSDWLAPLVAALEADPALGAVAPKVLLASPYRTVHVESTGPGRRGRGRVRVSGARIGDIDVTSGVRYRDGWSGPDGSPHDRGRWSVDPVATLLVPVDDTAAPGALRMRACAERRVTTAVGETRTTADVGADDTWRPLPSSGDADDLVNSVGVDLRPHGFAADRGYLVADRGQFDTPAEVDAWSGAAALLRRRYVDSVGPFDERLFLYYEDVDLSLRGRAQGWRYASVPASVVRHAHSTSTGADSELARFYNDRNRLVVLARHRPVGEVLRAGARFLAVTCSYATRDLRGTLGRGECIPERGVARVRMRAFAGFLRLAPAVVRSRRRDARKFPQFALKSDPETADGRRSG